MADRGSRLPALFAFLRSGVWREIGWALCRAEALLVCSHPRTACATEPRLLDLLSALPVTARAFLEGIGVETRADLRGIWSSSFATKLRPAFCAEDTLATWAVLFRASGASPPTSLQGCWTQDERPSKSARGSFPSFETVVWRNWVPNLDRTRCSARHLGCLARSFRPL